MKYVRLSPDARGDTHFSDAELDMKEADYRPPAPLMFVSHAYESSAIQFVRLPKGWSGSGITVPESQFLICVAGSLEITASDGMARTFGPGDVVLMEDTSGKGHKSRVAGSGEFAGAVAPIAS